MDQITANEGKIYIGYVSKLNYLLWFCECLEFICVFWIISLRISFWATQRGVHPIWERWFKMHKWIWDISLIFSKIKFVKNSDLVRVQIYKFSSLNKSLFIWGMSEKWVESPILCVSWKRQRWRGYREDRYDCSTLVIGLSLKVADIRKLISVIHFYACWGSGGAGIVEIDTIAQP